MPKQPVAQNKLMGTKFVDPWEREFEVVGFFFDSSDPCDYEWVRCKPTTPLPAGETLSDGTVGFPVRVVKNCQRRKK